MQEQAIKLFFLQAKQQRILGYPERFCLWKEKNRYVWKEMFKVKQLLKINSISYFDISRSLPGTSNLCMLCDANIAEIHGGLLSPPVSFRLQPTGLLIFEESRSLYSVVYNFHLPFQKRRLSLQAAIQVEHKE